MSVSNASLVWLLPCLYLVAAYDIEEASLPNDGLVLLQHSATPVDPSGAPDGWISIEDNCHIPEMEMIHKTRTLRMEHLILAPHHKTGYVMSRRCLKCVDAALGEGVAGFVMGRDVSLFEESFGPDTRVIHFSRDPLQLVLSLYLYAKQGAPAFAAESFLKNGSSKWKREKLTRENTNTTPQWYSKYPVNSSDETLRQYLVRVPDDVGLRLILQDALREAEDIANATTVCRRTTNCLEVSESQMTQSSGAFMHMWQTIFNWSHTNTTDEMVSCIGKQDMHSRAFQRSSDSLHCSGNTITGLQMDELVSLAKEVDASYFGGYYQNRSTEYRDARFAA